jgi:hypothetical protein
MGSDASSYLTGADLVSLLDVEVYETLNLLTQIVDGGYTAW